MDDGFDNALKHKQRDEKMEMRDTGTQELSGLQWEKQQIPWERLPIIHRALPWLAV